MHGLLLYLWVLGLSDQARQTETSRPLTNLLPQQVGPQDPFEAGWYLCPLEDTGGSALAGCTAHHRGI